MRINASLNILNFVECKIRLEPKESNKEMVAINLSWPFKLLFWEGHNIIGHIWSITKAPSLQPLWWFTAWNNKNHVSILLRDNKQCRNNLSKKVNHQICHNTFALTSIGASLFLFQLSCCQHLQRRGLHWKLE